MHITETDPRRKFRYKNLKIETEHIIFKSNIFTLRINLNHVYFFGIRKHFVLKMLCSDLASLHNGFDHLQADLNHVRGEW